MWSFCTRSWQSEMKVFRYMWTTSSLDGRRQKLFQELKEGSAESGVFILVLCNDHSRIMDIYASKYLRDEHIRDQDAWIIGAGATKEEACELAGSIVSLAVKNTGRADVYDYLAPYLTEEEVPDA